MSTKHVAAFAAAAVLFAGAVYAQDPPAQPPTVNQRLERQKNRAHLKELKDRRANGGTLTDQEKAELNRARNRHKAKP